MSTLEVTERIRSAGSVSRRAARGGRHNRDRSGSADRRAPALRASGRRGCAGAAVGTEVVSHTSSVSASWTGLSASIAGSASPRHRSVTSCSKIASTRRQPSTTCG